jgi:anti-sigma factor RsiW
MDCKINQEQLIDFQFGNIDLDTRAQVEAHLLGCSACLEEFLLLKRDVESAHVVALRPSAQVKAKIHREFLAYTYGQVREHPRRFIIGGLVAAAALVMILISGQVTRLNEQPAEQHNPQFEMTNSLNEAVDSGGTNPGHINII